MAEARVHVFTFQVPICILKNPKSNGSFSISSMLQLDYGDDKAVITSTNGTLFEGYVLVGCENQIQIELENFRDPCLATEMRQISQFRVASRIYGPDTRWAQSLSRMFSLIAAPEHKIYSKADGTYYINFTGHPPPNEGQDPIMIGLNTSDFIWTSIIEYEDIRYAHIVELSWFCGGRYVKIDSFNPVKYAVHLTSNINGSVIEDAYVCPQLFQL